jgi:hypothetical protein
VESNFAGATTSAPMVAAVMTTAAMLKGHAWGRRLIAAYASCLLARSKHDTAYWATATKGIDFSGADRVPPTLFNKALWNQPFQSRILVLELLEFSHLIRLQPCILPSGDKRSVPQCLLCG